MRFRAYPCILNFWVFTVEFIKLSKDMLTHLVLVRPIRTKHLENKQHVIKKHIMKQKRWVLLKHWDG